MFRNPLEKSHWLFVERNSAMEVRVSGRERKLISVFYVSACHILLLYYDYNEYYDKSSSLDSTNLPTSIN